MANILGVGIATLDIINRVSHYPAEDSEVRALSQTIRRGGNVTNTLTVLSQLGHQCEWTGTLAADSDVEHILKDLGQYQVKTSYAKRYQNGKVPTSYILLNEATGSRSIVHYRDLPELDYDHFKSIPLDQFNWVHFEARNIEQTALMLKHLKSHYPHIPCSVEFEKARDDIEQLLPYPDVLIFSKNFSISKGFDTAGDFLNNYYQQDQSQTSVLAWGEQGAYALANGEHVIHSPAFKPRKIINSIGAGDTFNAGLINALIAEKSIDHALAEANKLASLKLEIDGFDFSGHTLSDSSVNNDG